MLAFVYIHRTPASPCVSRYVSRSILPKQHVSSDSNIRGHDPAWHDDAPHTHPPPSMQPCQEYVRYGFETSAYLCLCECIALNIPFSAEIHLWPQPTSRLLLAWEIHVYPYPTSQLCSPDPITSTWMRNTFLCVTFPVDTTFSKGLTSDVLMPS